MSDATQFTFSWPGYEAACIELAGMVRANGFQPDIVIGFETGGAFVAGLLKKLLGAETMIVMDVKVDEVYHLGGLVQLNRMMIAGKRVLLADDGVVKGDLLKETETLVTELGGEPRSASMVGIGDYPRNPHLYVARNLPVAPRLPWKLSPI